MYSIFAKSNHAAAAKKPTLNPDGSCSSRSIVLDGAGDPAGQRLRLDGSCASQSIPLDGVTSSGPVVRKSRPLSLSAAAKVERDQAYKTAFWQPANDRIVGVYKPAAVSLDDDLESLPSFEISDCEAEGSAEEGEVSDQNTTLPFDCSIDSIGSGTSSDPVDVDAEMPKKAKYARERAAKDLKAGKVFFIDSTFFF